MKSKGFSLIEILIIIAVIGILSLISLPIYRSINPTLSLNANTRQIASHLRQAQQLAVEEQNNYTAVFDINTNYYEIINMQSSSTVISQTLQNNITIDSISNLTDNTVTFTITGSALESGEIILKNANNETKNIEIKPSGYVKI